MGPPRLTVTRVESFMHRLLSSSFHRLYQRAVDWLASTLLHDRNATYNRQTLEVMRRLLRRDSICVDMGAHRGDILRHMVAIAPDGTHRALEALPHLATELRKNFPAVVVHEIVDFPVKRTV